MIPIFPKYLKPIPGQEPSIKKMFIEIALILLFILILMTPIWLRLIFG